MAEEQEAVIDDPPKGKNRVASNSEVSNHLTLIQQSNCHCAQNSNSQKRSKAKAGETSKKPRNEELPDWVDVQWFRHTFVTTYMAFVGQTLNPWDVPCKQTVEVMQKIWDATSNHQYKIEKQTAIYEKVCGGLSFRTMLKYISDGSTPCGLVAQSYRKCWHCGCPCVLWQSRRIT